MISYYWIVCWVTEHGFHTNGAHTLNQSNTFCHWQRAASVVNITFNPQIGKLWFSFLWYVFLHHILRIWLEFKANVEEIELIKWRSHTKPKSLCWIKHVFKLRVNRKLSIKLLNVFLKYRLSMLLSQLWTLSDHCVATTNKLFSSTTVFTYLTYDFYSCRLKPDWWIWGFWGGKIFGFVAETACNCYYSSIKLSFAFKKGHILDKSVSKSILELCFRLMIQ